MILLSIQLLAIGLMLAGAFLRPTAPAIKCPTLSDGPLPAPFVLNDLRITVLGLLRDPQSADLIVLLRADRAGAQVFGPDHPFIFHGIPGIRQDRLKTLREIIGEAVRVALIQRDATGPLDDDPTLIVFPDSGKPGTTSVDGDVGTNGTGSYTTAHSTADCTDCSGGTVAATENSGTKLASPCNQIPTYSVIRILLNFDTSALGSSATIYAATLSVKPSLISQNTHADFIRVVTNAGASNNDFSISDYVSFGTTAQANDINVSSLSAGTYADFSLNTTGLSNISKTGVTRFGLRCGMDINSTTPTPKDSRCVTNSADGTVVFWDSADVTGTNRDPKLVITYTPSGRGLATNVSPPVTTSARFRPRA